MGTVVAAVRLAPDPAPRVLLSGHLHGPGPILVYRVADYEAAVATARAAGFTNVRELEIPHGPCASFEGPDGQRLAVYELVRPGADEHMRQIRS